MMPPVAPFPPTRMMPPMAPFPPTRMMAPGRMPPGRMVVPFLAFLIGVWHIFVPGDIICLVGTFARRVGVMLVLCRRICTSLVVTRGEGLAVTWGEGLVVKGLRGDDDR